MPLDFVKAMRASATAKKGKVSVVAIKQVSKAITGMGKTVAAVSVQADGSFTVTAADPASKDTTPKDEWDVVLSK